MSKPIVYPWGQEKNRKGGKKKKQRTILEPIYFHQHTIFSFFAYDIRLPQLPWALRAQSQSKVSNQSSPNHSNTPYRLECQF